jgi:hypothetical protein
MLSKRKEVQQSILQKSLNFIVVSYDKCLLEEIGLKLKHKNKKNPQVEM